MRISLNQSHSVVNGTFNKYLNVQSIIPKFSFQIYDNNVTEYEVGYKGDTHHITMDETLDTKVRRGYIQISIPGSLNHEYDILNES
ncbi:unnamed protein product, partial [Schistosoma margrebowiei]|uniref:Uncharacterized protein n=1 Tax=Schistosoma margrebowiei TaxID=48269 RepID=A0AA84ZST6_9TREM